MTDTDALTRWASYPAPHAKRTPCPYCGRTFTVTCGEDDHQRCGRYLAKAVETGINKGCKDAYSPSN